MRASIRLRNGNIDITDICHNDNWSGRIVWGRGAGGFVSLVGFVAGTV